MKKGEPEKLLLDYPLHQARLIPKFAGLLAGQIFITELTLIKAELLPKEYD